MSLTGEKDATMIAHKTKRSSVLGCLTKLKSIVSNSTADTMTCSELETRLGMLEGYYKKFDEYQTAIEVLDMTELNNDKRSTFEESYCSIKTQILMLVNAKKPRALVSSHNETLNTSSVQRKAAKLPKIPLTKFSGNYTEWPSFYSMFMTLVDSDEELTRIEKFQHLRSCLTKTALLSIETMELSEDNYSAALELLKSRFSNKRLVFQAHVRQLFEIKPVNSASSQILREVSDSVNSHLRALQSLGAKEQLADGLLTFLIGNKLDTQTQAKWEEEAQLEVIPTWDDMSTFLNKRCQMLENMECGIQQSTNNKRVNYNQNSRQHQKSNKVLIASNSPNVNCIFCKSVGHNIYNCQKFSTIPVEKRISEARSLNLCLNCLRTGHPTRFCGSKCCKECNRRHNSLLHLEQDPTRNSDAIHRTDEPSLPSTSQQSSSSHQSRFRPDSNNTVLASSSKPNQSSNEDADNFVFLATAVVLVRDKYNKLVPARALLDSASQLHFVTSRFAHILALKQTSIDMSVSGINSSQAVINRKINITLKSRINEYSKSFDCFILPSITENQPNRNFNSNAFTIPNNIELADPFFYKAQKIDILIGASLFFELLSIGQIRLGESKPLLQKTRLGWIVSGNFHNVSSNNICLTVTKNDCENNVNDLSLNQLVKGFWEMESHEHPSQTQTPEEVDCENHFLQTYTRLPSGQYAVRLPFKDAPNRLGSSFEVAKRMFFNLEAKLNRNPETKKLYAEFISEYEQLNHLRLAPADILHKNHYFLPHHCVLKPESTTTKLRVVFNGAFKTSTGTSLNDILMNGPTIQNDLFSTLLNFRTHQFAVTADIAKMYRCVQIQEPDEHFQCILWRDKDSGELVIYNLTTVTYGTKPASFLSIRSLHQLAHDEQESFPLGSQEVKTKFYVDDLLTGADTLEDLLKIKTEVSEILLKGGFHLRKWCSNSEELLAGIPLTEREEFLQINNGSVTKTLGLIWNPKADEFWFSTNRPDLSKRITKRTVLSWIAQLYDPLGFIGPIIVQAKLFIQCIWKENLDWDETLPFHLHTQWKQFCDEIPFINNIKLPRYVLSPKANLQIHGFADASTHAYGACIFVRSFDDNGTVKTRLLCSKSRVAPINTVSVPRLELAAALLLAELVDRVLKTMSLNFKEIFCWTDSTIVLAWISSPACTWNTFVANRVAKIKNLSSRYNWRHVRTNQNPADVLSRGISPSNLIHFNLWFYGPCFLKESSERWPVLETCSNENLPERRSVKSCLSVTKNILDMAEESMYLNDFKRLRLTFAYIERFIENSTFQKPYRNNLPLSAFDLDSGLKLLIKCIQIKAFPEDYKRLTNQMDLHKDSILKTLHPFLDDRGVLRIGGRLSQSFLSYDAKHQIILPKDHKFTKTLIDYYHVENHHAGCQATICLLRERFWPLGGRHTIRKVLRKCTRCFKARPVVCQQIMGDLPYQRIQPTRPFLHSGIDFCGPFYTKSGIRGRGPTKTYVCLFVCMVTKAVHLELAVDLSTTAFLSALRRFISRRGKPRMIFSDNATNFVGANSKLQELKTLFDNQQQHFDPVRKECLNNGIDWKFIPPRSPHFGGLWEAAVKIAKFHLRRIVGYASLNYDDLNTLLCQIEAIINSRPLSPISDDPADLNALTPGHFLVGTSLTSIPEPDYTAEKPGRLKSWQLRQSMQQHFWNRWSREYLHTLQERHKWSTPVKNISIGTLVIIKDDNLPPLKWPMGRVLEIFKGSDGYVRVVNLKTQNGIVKRAISKICILPMPNEEEDTVEEIETVEI